MAYQVLEVQADTATQLEQLGSKGKFWFQDKDGVLVLFKEGRPGTGENWAEKVASELAKLLGIPCAEYDFAISGAKLGTASRTFVPHHGRLIHGNELLAKLAKDYNQDATFRARQHTLKLVMTLLRHFPAPQQWVADEVIKRAHDVFCGYLMLDALIGNTDRHHENWGVIASSDGVFLAPSYDHAASLGRNESDVSRIERLRTNDEGRTVEAYAMRSRSAFYDSISSRKAMLNFDVFASAARICPEASAEWVFRLSSITDDSVDAILNSVPDEFISTPARDFARRFILFNRSRILDLMKVRP